MKVGILGAGNIARKMAATVNGMNGVTLGAVASRSMEKAKAFAEEFSAEKYYDSYEALAADSDIDLIYVATPHSHHYEHALLCLNAGRNVLCEKAFTANYKQASELISLAESKGLYIGEAIWTRYLPMRFKLDEIIASGVIGEISSLTANLGYSIAHVERLVKPELAGGALLDLGVYTINFALMAFGTDIKEIRSSCVKNEYGVDTHNTIIIEYNNGRTAILHSNMNANTDLKGIIYGSNGRIEFENVNNCEGINVYLNDGTVTRYDTPPQITGFEYQVETSLEAIRQGSTECGQMPHSEILRVMKIMDDLRKEWGIIYPFEEK